ncbi:MAG: RidA family protein [Actinomycetota bacterium]|nr:RidA family protein [Actinomycetota bacterium]
MRANEVTGAGRTIFCAGQTSNEDGRLAHPGDLRAQFNKAMDNLETVLGEADAAPSDVVRLTYYTTDVDRFLEIYDTVVGRLAEAGCRPSTTLLGVARLISPEILVEIEATAVV